jgi:prepilin-type N-terminal cleavage/methylation domain-containing protein
LKIEDFKMPSKICRFKKGFTLIEILIAVVLLGLAMVAIVASNAAFTQATAEAAQLSTAEFLIEQIRELTALLPATDPNSTGTFGPEEVGIALYDDVDDFDGAVFNPVIDCQRRQLTGFSGYSQAVTVENVSANNFQQTVTDGSSDFVRVTVRILHQNNEIAKTSWIRSTD